MTNSQPPELRKCARCGEQEFVAAYPEQMLCWMCRKLVIRKERAAAKQEQRKEIAAIDLELMWDRKRRHEWDILIVDEAGREVWAKDLAKRYREELDARQRRDWKRAKPAK